jgi:hypothetical protein
MPCDREGHEAGRPQQGEMVQQSRTRPVESRAEVHQSARTGAELVEDEDACLIADGAALVTQRSAGIGHAVLVERRVDDDGQLRLVH